MTFPSYAVFICTLIHTSNNILRLTVDANVSRRLFPIKAMKWFRWRKWFFFHTTLMVLLSIFWILLLKKRRRAAKRDAMAKVKAIEASAKSRIEANKKAHCYNCSSSTYEIHRHAVYNHCSGMMGEWGGSNGHQWTAEAKKWALWRSLIVRARKYLPCSIIENIHARDLLTVSIDTHLILEPFSSLNLAII